MIILVLIGLGVLASVLTRGTPLFVPAVANAVVAFWSNGVMWNFRHDPVSPRWAVAVSMLTPILALLLIAASFVVR